jgi:hypothetical protein
VKELLFVQKNRLAACLLVVTEDCLGSMGICGVLKRGAEKEAVKCRRNRESQEGPVVSERSEGRHSNMRKLKFDMRKRENDAGNIEQAR